MEKDHRKTIESQHVKLPHYKEVLQTEMNFKDKELQLAKEAVQKEGFHSCHVQVQNANPFKRQRNQAAQSLTGWLHQATGKQAG